MRLRLTQYGLSAKAVPTPGWDNPGDSGTDKRIGNEDNYLHNQACALSPDTFGLLDVKDGAVLRIKFDNGYLLFKEVLDTTDLSLHGRVDIFNPLVRDKQQDAAGDYAEVTVIYRK